ncbi:unnamed protein product [Phytomonas sp. Hart1]|nr:unnamed protein product [Phytomonas sp. Hart1]|eukprot:CCW70554.1 unnamed protein product [Phytomonas sp. isolate Hart1]
MSWQDYIDQNLIGSGNMHSSAIIGLKDGCYWAHGGAYVPQTEEIKLIQKSLENLSLINSSGIIINGVKFFGLQSGVDGNSTFIFSKKGLLEDAFIRRNKHSLLAFMVILMLSILFRKVFKVKIQKKK